MWRRFPCEQNLDMGYSNLRKLLMSIVYDEIRRVFVLNILNFNISYIGNDLVCRILIAGFGKRYLCFLRLYTFKSFRMGIW